jgi:hypothetical protein
MYADDDHDLEGEGWKLNHNKKRKKIRTNPAGPYIVNFIFKGVNWDITIENLSHDDYKVTASSNKKVSIEEVNILKKYLQDEGFEQAAKKHNLYW